jgi:hypothetical protein
MARVFTDAGAMSLAAPVADTLTNFGSFSVAFWLYRTATPAAERALIVSYNGVAGAGWVINLLAANQLQAYFTFTTQDKVRKSVTAPALNTWVHCVVTHENRGLADTDWLFFFNGVQEAGTAVATGVGTHSFTGTTLLRIGNNSATALTAPPVNLGPVALWSRALSPAECLRLAGGAHPLRCKEGLVDWFDMETGGTEEGRVSRIFLAQGATNASSAFVNPPVESASSVWTMETRQNLRPMMRTRARRSIVAAGGAAVAFLVNWFQEDW